MYYSIQKHLLRLRYTVIYLIVFVREGIYIILIHSNYALTFI
jgi:hypothetical protein